MATANQEIEQYWLRKTKEWQHTVNAEMQLGKTEQYWPCKLWGKPKLRKYLNK